MDRHARRWTLRDAIHARLRLRRECPSGDARRPARDDRRSSLWSWTRSKPVPARLEGALGAITEAWIRVQPRPTHRASATVTFSDFDAAVEATRAIAQARLEPANCRLLDATETMINELDVAGQHALVLGFESLDAPVEGRLEAALGHCRGHGGEAVESGEASGSDAAGEWRDAFVEAPYRFNELVSIGVLVDTFETAVTWDRFPDLHEDLTTAVSAAMREVCGGGIMSCRFTHVYPDGPAPYYTLLAPATVGEELEQWRSIKETASRILGEYDATITHHHAVGRVHREWYTDEVPDPYLEALRSMKRTLDPAGIMNPGALIPP
ncbi:MAG: FAD-linked oxidase C-terminal domain-containing protein [Natrialbaceae archaeon]|nr:FAD-linked oxidase C-terminal domain-containing protein [Natrialbaceae archaeon]